MKVFFDTNVLISAYTVHGLSADLFRLVLAEHELLTGEVNLLESRRVLGKRFRVPEAEVIPLNRQRGYAEWTQVFPNDRMFKVFLDRITDRAQVIETGTESCRYRSTTTIERRI